MNGRRFISRFSGYPMLQFFTWATISCFNPYVTIILADRGLDNTSIGIVLTANALISIVAQPVWGLVSDRIRSIRKVYILCFAAAGGVILLIPFARSMAQLLVVYPLVLFFLSPIAPLLDVWTYQGVSSRPGSSYGLLRLWGSLGFALMVIPIGRLVSLYGYNLTSIGFAALAATSIVISLGLPGISVGRDVPVMKHKNKPRIRSLLGQYHYLSFLFIIFLAFISIQPMFGFHARLMLDVGGTQELFMWTMALAALSEIPIFIGSKWLVSRFLPAHLIVVAFAVFIFRMVAYSYVTSPWQITVIGLTHGLSFALFLVATVNYIDELAPAGLKSTALTLASAIYMGLSGVIGNTLAGRLMDKLQIRPVYRIGAVFMVIVLGLFLLSLLTGRRIQARSVPPSA
jgi:PPP family 3-phenylpropionic acid transporter